MGSSTACYSRCLVASLRPESGDARTADLDANQAPLQAGTCHQVGTLADISAVNPPREGARTVGRLISKQSFNRAGCPESSFCLDSPAFLRYAFSLVRPPNPEAILDASVPSMVVRVGRGLDCGEAPEKLLFFSRPSASAARGKQNHTQVQVESNVPRGVA